MQYGKAQYEGVWTGDSTSAKPNLLHKFRLSRKVYTRFEKEKSTHYINGEKSAFVLLCESWVGIVLLVCLLFKVAMNIHFVLY